MAAELIEAYRSGVGKGHVIESIELIPSGGGVFDVEVDCVLVYSKFTTGRHAEPGEVLRLIRGRPSASS